jgi:acylphosphatase
LTRVRIVITGRVQGVWFRDSMRDVARREGVSGWVRNRSDGAVEAEIEGPKDAVDRVVAWCHEGSPRARVDGVEVTEIQAVGARSFHVR